ncbi:DUF202 domain-containing protein [Streptomyces sp. NBC_01261]|uniref:DUF202 domain-containing protein n=1 Tax=unclassified Streptomyces TaxID=2593676 RepID=UPI002E2DB615|nr:MULTISPECIES: DUF202 domain-containing protein [unclassified Streptomyces]
MTRLPTPDRDPGLQPERTRLAWRRTTLSSTVAAVLAAKASLRGGVHVEGVIVCALCCALWLSFLTVAHHRIRTLAAAGTPPPLAPRHASAAVLCTVALAVCAAVLVY